MTERLPFVADHSMPMSTFAVVAQQKEAPCVAKVSAKLPYGQLVAARDGIAPYAVWREHWRTHAVLSQRVRARRSGHPPAIAQCRESIARPSRGRRRRH